MIIKRRSIFVNQVREESGVNPPKVPGKLCEWFHLRKFLFSACTNSKAKIDFERRTNPKETI